MSSQLRMQSAVIPSKEDVNRVFVRVTRTPIRNAVAIALDFSESCSDTLEISTRLHRLFLKTRLDTPLWLFRLSDRTPISDVAVDKVEHLVHGSLSLLSYVSDREKNVIASYSGTLLRPVIETIKQLQRKNKIAKISLVVVTDGELLDREALAIPESISVIGIQIKTTIPKNWIRVLGPIPLYSWDDPKLTYQSLFPNDSSVMYMSVALEKQVTTVSNAESFFFSPLAKIKILQWVSATNTIEIQDRVKMGETDTEVNFVLESSMPIPIETSLIVNDGLDQLLGTFVLSKLDKMELNQIPHVFLGNSEVEKPSGFWNTILDYRSLESGQDLAQAWYSFFEIMAKNRKKWLDNEKEFTELQSHFKGADSEVTSLDALIAMVELDAAGQVNRVIVFGLSKSAKPAICWGKDVSVPWGVAEQEFSMHYDRLEARWILLAGQIQLDLAPIMSQKIEFEILSKPRWHFYFSGRIQP